MRMNDFRPGAAQLFPVIRKSLNKARGMGGEIRVEVALGNGDLPYGVPVFLLAFEPKLRGDPVPIEVLHHRHHEIPGADGEMDGMDDSEHCESFRFVRTALPANPETSKAPTLARRCRRFHSAHFSKSAELLPLGAGPIAREWIRRENSPPTREAGHASI